MNIDCVEPGQEGYAVDLRIDVRHVFVTSVTICLQKYPDEPVWTTIHYVLKTIDDKPDVMYPAGTLVYPTIEQAEAERQQRIDAIRESFRKGEIQP